MNLKESVSSNGTRPRSASANHAGDDIAPGVERDAVHVAPEARARELMRADAVFVPEDLHGISQPFA